MRRIAIPLLLLAGALHAWLYRAFQPDDTFIVLVYAKNWLAGNGLTFNGDRVEGFSSLMWTLLVAGAGLTGVDLLTVAKALAGCAYLLTGVVVMRAPQLVRPGSSGAPALLAMYFALAPLALWAAGALETSLLTLLLTSACLMCFRAVCVTMHPRDHVVAGLLFGALAWTRPEGMAYVGAMAAFAAIRGAAAQRWDPKNAALAVLVAAMMGVALLAWRLGTYGEWLPSSAAAKTGNLPRQIVLGEMYLRGFLKDYGWLAAIYAAASVVLFLRRGPAAWWAALVLIVVAGQASFALLAGGDWMLGYRFLVCVFPLAISVIWLAAGSRTGTRAAIAIAVVAVGLFQSAQLLPAARAQASSDFGDVRMGRYIRDLHLPPDSRIAVLDAGAIPYLSGLPTIDMAGLNNAHIAHLPGEFMGRWDNEYVLAQRPQIIQMQTVSERGFVIPSETFAGTSRLFYSPEFQRWYEFDPRSPIPHLFRRRRAPQEHTFLETFGDAQWHSTWDATSATWTADVRKTGAGVWPAAAADSALHVGQAYVHLQLLTPTGAVRAEKYLPITTPVVRGETVHLQAQLPAGVGEVKACLVLFWVTDALGCDSARAGR